MKTKALKKNKGFSLIETMIYIAFVSIIAISMGSFFSIILKAQLRNQQIVEVEKQGVAILEMIAREIKYANSVNSPIINATSSVLSLETENIDSTLIELSGKNIQIKEGSNDYVIINNDKILISNLEFSTLGENDDVSVKVKFSVTSSRNINTGETPYSKDFYISITLR